MLLHTETWNTASMGVASEGSSKVLSIMWNRFYSKFTGGTMNFGRVVNPVTLPILGPPFFGVSFLCQINIALGFVHLGSSSFACVLPAGSNQNLDDKLFFNFCSHESLPVLLCFYWITKLAPPRVQSSISLLYVDTSYLRAHFLAWSPRKLPLACHQSTPIPRTP